ncbi:MAG: TonB-dependent receptor family protein [Reichenbachiella sp.]
MRKFHLIILLSCLHLSLYAQQEILIVGQVVDTKNQPIDFAVVRAMDKTSNKVLTGATASVDGEFSFTIAQSNFYLEVGFIGYVSKRIDQVNYSQNSIDLGTVVLAMDSKQLEEVVVRAEKSQTEFKLDKRVFNVGSDITSAGMNALEVLNNVPSVNVDIEGTISLRGSTGVQVLINGKPSVLTADGSNALGTITADMIDKIEVITNPSAKYDAEGTAGIINIIIKKDERKGTNGSISLNTGLPHNHSLGFSLNRRTEHFNLFTQIGVGYRELPNDIENINMDKTTGSTIKSVGEEFRNENFYNFILGADYHINDYNVLTVTGNYAYEIEDQPSTTLFSSIENDAIVSEWRRTEETSATNPKYHYELNYKKEFKDDTENHTLLFSALGNFFGKDLSSEFTNETVSGVEDQDSEQRTETEFQQGNYTFKLDYAKPINDEWSLETGGQYLITDVSNDYAVSDWIEGGWLLDTTLTNVFNYDLKVLGLYATAAYEGNSWGLKGGLRMENTDLTTYLENTDETNYQKFTNFFPSAHASFKVKKNLSVQAGYSRRIFRPRLWDLNPFFNVRNNYSIRMGNPELMPEFTDSYELSSISDFDKVSLNVTVFHRYTTDVIERVSTVEDNVNTVKPYNIGSERSTGLEINAKYDALKWLTINGDFNYSYFIRDGLFEYMKEDQLVSQSFDFDATRWSTKINTKFKLPAKIDIEVTGRYQSEYQTVQSVMSDVFYIDFGIRKKVMNGKGVISGSVRDVFASRKRESVTDQEDFYLYNSRLRGRFITLGFSYGFGKGEAMQYSGGRR